MKKKHFPTKLAGHFAIMPPGFQSPGAIHLLRLAIQTADLRKTRAAQPQIQPHWMCVNTCWCKIFGGRHIAGKSNSRIDTCENVRWPVPHSLHQLDCDAGTGC
jgi:hypothetical protein